MCRCVHSQVTSPGSNVQFKCHSHTDALIKFNGSQNKPRCHEFWRANGRGTIALTGMGGRLERVGRRGFIDIHRYMYEIFKE